MTLRAVVLKNAAELAALETEWYELLADSDANEPTVCPLWVMAWWRAYGSDDDRALRTLVVRDGARLVGVVPLLSRTHRYRLGQRFRRLELVPSGEEEADEVLSEYIGPVVARGSEAQVAGATVDAIVAGEVGEWDELVCPRMGAWRESVHALEQAFVGRGYPVTMTPNGECSYIRLPKTWDEYLASLPKKHRYSVRQALRDFDAWAGAEQELRICKLPSELAQGAEILRSLHGERWNAKGGTGAFHSHKFSQFHEEVMPKLLERGALQLVWLLVRGEPVAALYNLIWNRSVSVYQSGRRVDVPRQVRAGIALHAMMIRRAIEEGLTEYDFLAGEGLYKSQLGTMTRGLVALRVTPPGSVKERGRLLIDKGVDLARTLRDRIRKAQAAEPERPAPPEPATSG